MRGYVQIREEDGFKRIHYPSKFWRRKFSGGDARTAAEAELYNKLPTKQIYDKKRRQKYDRLNAIRNSVGAAGAKAHHIREKARGSVVDKYNRLKEDAHRTHTQRTASRDFVKMIK